jgi:dipeptidase D
MTLPDTPIAPLTEAPFNGLSPAPVWAHFATLCRIPRPSKHEGALREVLQQWAQARGLATVVDAAGTLIVHKPASPGCEGAPGVVLQGHLDMVTQKNSDTVHDFFTDPIRPVLHEGWLRAEGTTLGADNGIGVALSLAVLADTGLVHGPIEALFTVDEEAGMGGAQGLAAGALTGRLMLNLDTEEWGEFYLGCAGGVDVNVHRPGQPEPMPAGHVARLLTLRGLRGGHSGVDIHEERGNAIKLLVRVLQGLIGAPGMTGTSGPLTALRLARLQGGTARNALPREAFAVVSLPAEQASLLDQALADWQVLLLQELTGVEPGLQLVATPTEVAQVMSLSEQTVWLRSLHAAPHGVRRMSRRVPGVVETSNNLGVLGLTPEQGEANFMVRSLLDSGSTALAAEIASLFALSGSEVRQEGAYPGWAPNPDSALLALCQRVYQARFGQASKVQVIHAGLECGILAAKHPGMDIVSFGPTIRGAHAPGERVEVATVQGCWDLLTAILAEAATARA